MESILSLERKVGRLITEYSQARQRISQLEQELSRTQTTLHQANARIADLNSRLNNMRTAGSLAASAEQKEETRLRIDRMVKDIDRCIKLMSL
ncbi:MAG: hypothetical protein IJ680_02740 [Paludibacteraceae bacterium]|nr:hypothetical protein [Paludibacteraceae bacterium]